MKRALNEGKKREMMILGARKKKDKGRNEMEWNEKKKVKEERS